LYLEKFLTGWGNLGRKKFIFKKISKWLREPLKVKLVLIKNFKWPEKPLKVKLTLRNNSTLLEEFKKSELLYLENILRFKER